MRAAVVPVRAERTLRLLATVLGAGDGGEVHASARAAMHPRDWAALVAMAGWHGLQPALHHALAESGRVADVPDAPRHTLDAAAAVAGLRAEARRRQLHEVLVALRDAGVPVIALKGAYVAEHLYAAPALRLMSDLDLLLRALDVTRAWDALVALGYGPSAAAAPVRHAPALVRAARLPVELHHTIEPCAPPFAASIDDVWRRAVPTVLADVSVLALAPEDLLLHLATHMAHSHLLGTSLANVYDVVLWTARFGATADWDALVRRAQAARVAAFTYAALALAQRTFGARVPAASLAALRTAAADDRMVAHAMELLAAPPVVLLGAKALTDPRDDLGARTWRVARALFVSPSRGPLLRLLAVPTTGWSAARHVVRVRALRRWATGQAP